MANTHILLDWDWNNRLPIIDGYPLSTSFRLNPGSDCTFAKIDTCYQWRVNIITNFFLCRSPQLTKAELNKACFPLGNPCKNSSLWYITDGELETLLWGFEDIFLTIKLFCTDLDHSGWRAMRQMLCVLHFVCLLNKDNRQWQKLRWRWWQQQQGMTSTLMVNDQYQRQ